MIHSQLHLSKNIHKIDFKVYTEELTKQLMNSLGESENIIIIKCPEEKVMLSISQIKTLGLIINESITNSVKHGLKETKDKKIILSLSYVESRYELMIRDNGKGMSKDNDTTQKTGLFLIEQLCEELDAEFSLHSKNGTEIKIQFPGAEFENFTG